MKGEIKDDADIRGVPAFHEILKWMQILMQTFAHYERSFIGTLIMLNHACLIPKQ